MRRHRVRAMGLAATAGLAVLVTACTSGGTAGTPASAITDAKNHAPTTIDVWSFHKLPNEIAAFKATFEDLKKKYPWLTVNFVPNKDDATFAKAVAAGTPPDVFISWGPDNLAKFCYDGTVVDQNGYLKSAGIDPVKVFPTATLGYTQFEQKQCALPLLTDVYGLYYNKKLFAQAGIAGPPKTLSELTEDVKKLTKRDASGKITQFGFVPRSDYNLNTVIYGGNYSGARFYDANGKSTLATDPSWPALLQWDRDLVHWLGEDQVQKFVGTNNAHTDDAGNPFVTGKAAMELHGEWHIGELAEQAPTLDYGIAPFPVLDSAAATYGGGVAAGTVVYLPAKAKHQQEAFFAAQQLATDTTFLTKLATVVSNVPTTFESLAAWDKKDDPHWKPMLDIYTKTKITARVTSPAGAEDGQPWTTFVQEYEVGKVSDVKAGLVQVAAKVDAVNAQARR
jgi:multiple sugar transport system substrate-binding protein